MCEGSCHLLGAKRQGGDGNVVKLNVELGGTVNQLLADHHRHTLTLGDELRGVEASHNRLEHLVDDRGENTLVEVGTQVSVQLREVVAVGLVQHTERNVDRLKICGR